MYNFSKSFTEKIIERRQEKNPYRIKRRYISKLDPFRYEILMMNNELNCSLNTIRLWLKSKQGIEISTAAIHKRLLIWKQFDKGVSRHDTQE